jgi:TPP-dependent pyruvate/acetoin dehydrogenase alpha subunit
MKLQRWLEVNGKLSSAELKLIEDHVAEEINLSVAFAERSEIEDISDLYLGVYAESGS